MNTRTIFGLGLSGLLWAGCGGDDEPKGPNGAARYNAIAGSIANPTGTLDDTTAADVAREYEKISTTGAGGRRVLQSQTQSTTISCPSGGTYGISVSASQSGGVSTITYDNCCYVDASCCFSGGGDMYYSVAAGAAYSYCASYSLSVACGIASGSASYEGCFDTTGEWTYVIRVAGETFTVTGSLSSGSGTLSVVASNGSYTCTYTNYSGTCTGGSGSFRF